MPRPPTAFLFRRLLVAIAGLAALTGAPMTLAEGLQHSRQGDYTLVSGGLDSAGLEALEKLAPRYQIQLLFKRRGNKEALLGVRVRVRNTAGDLVVETTTPGPYLYLNPPAGGRFTIEAELDGETLTRTRDLVGRRYLHLEFDFGTKPPSP